MKKEIVMSWIRKNWLMVIIITLCALPLLSSLLNITIRFDNGTIAFINNIPESIKVRALQAGKKLTQWGLPLRQSGEMAVRMLVITLTCTPLFILFGNKKILRYKKVFGIYTFVYTMLHLVFYLAEHSFFEIFGSMGLILALMATAIIIPLGITSNKYSMRLLKANWKRIQQWAYIAGIAAVLHLVFLGEHSWVLYGMILGAGFILRSPRIKQYFINRRTGDTALAS